MASEIHVNDIGTQLKITVLDGGSTVDLSSATLKQVEFRKPDDTSVTRTASLFGDGSGSSGVMYYNTVAGDFDQTGNCQEGRATRLLPHCLATILDPTGIR